MSRAVGVAAGVVAALVVAAVATWYFVVRDATEPVGVDEAVTSFRTDTESVPGPGAGESLIPEGVYVYETDGFEQTDALLGEKHDYPARTTITVTAAGCGSSLLWRPVTGRSTRLVVCATRDGWELRTQDERHTFYGQTETTTYRCEDTLVRPGDESTREWDVSCTTGSTDETGTGTLVGRETIRVGGEAVEAEHVRRGTTLTGETRGSTTHDIWFDPATGVPVKLVLVSHTANDSPIGEVHYDEDVTLVLTSLEPRR
jgi:hypothetical protein